MHFIDHRNYSPALERKTKRLKHSLCLGPGWPVPHSWATIPLLAEGIPGVGGGRQVTCQEPAGSDNLLLAWFHTEQSWSSSQDFLNLRDLNEALGPSSTSEPAENPHPPPPKAAWPHRRWSAATWWPPAAVSSSRAISPSHPTCP